MLLPLHPSLCCSFILHSFDHVPVAIAFRSAAERVVLSCERMGVGRFTGCCGPPLIFSACLALASKLCSSPNVFFRIAPSTVWLIFLFPHLVVRTPSVLEKRQHVTLMKFLVFCHLLRGMASLTPPVSPSLSPSCFFFLLLFFFFFSVRFVVRSPFFSLVACDAFSPLSLCLSLSLNLMSLCLLSLCFSLSLSLPISPRLV